MTLINQNNNTQSGEHQEIVAVAGGVDLPPELAKDLIIGGCIGFTLIAITLILVIGKLIQTAILKINVLTKKQIEYIIDTIKKDIDT